MRLSNVLLPEPDGPVIVTNSDAATVRETPRSARVGPNDLTTSRAATSTPPSGVVSGRPAWPGERSGTVSGRRRALTFAP